MSQFERSVDARGNESWSAECDVATRALVEEAVGLLFQRVNEVERKTWDYLQVIMNQGEVFLAVSGRNWGLYSSRMSVSLESSELLSLMMKCADDGDDAFKASERREREVFGWICEAARASGGVRYVDWEDEDDTWEAIDFGADYPR